MQSPDITATFCATLVDEWVRRGVGHAVVAPGSRSTPMALALLDCPGLAVHVFHDERSAAFAALGMASVSRLPTLLLCTSGTAAANFFPAVIEASHNEVPMLVLTADRPPELHGRGAPQTIDQQHLYGSVVRGFIDTGVPDDADSAQWRATATRAWNASVSGRPGPVHVNLAFREPLVGLAGALPPVIPESRNRNIASGARLPRVGSQQLSQFVARCSAKRGVIVAGARGPTPRVLMSLAHHLGWPVIADPLGGARSGDALAIRHADSWLRDTAIAARFAPEVVLRFGTLPASKVIGAWLRDVAADVVAISETPYLIDPDQRVSMHVVADSDVLCGDLQSVLQPADSDWSDLWRQAEATARTEMAAQLDDEALLSEPGVARNMVAGLPAGSRLVVSSSMPIRDVEWYGGDMNHLVVQANRGVNGIDGVVSTAVGVAAASGKPTGLLIGDIAFLHDQNGLIEVAQRSVDLRMVVVDNRGGGIFSFLPQRSTLDAAMFERVFGTPHRVDLGHLAQAHGLKHQHVQTAAQLRSCIATAGPHITLVSTNRDANVVRHDEIHQRVIARVRAVLAEK
ncbi:MAG: 2-succinyl-5-enolpyruvyl-6-hydroxy-3-cyclohexene-carboxylic-acid synthase [Actinomycetota bacterium]|jgi:2-succinyl-5-enolpyruvyl-6-hydroxy-3-cyclohexene-1-carboxylate synthase